MKISILIGIIAIILFSGCATQNRCARKFPPQVKVVTEMVTETIYRDTTIYIHVPADTIYSEKIVFKTADGYQTEKSTLDMLYSYSTAQVVNGNLLHYMMQKETEIERMIKNAVKEQSTNTVETIVEIHKERYIPIYIWVLLGLIVGLGLIGWVRRS